MSQMHGRAGTLGVMSYLEASRRVFWNTLNAPSTKANARDMSVFCLEMRERLAIVAKDAAKKGNYESFHFVMCSVSEEDVPRIEEAYPEPASVFDFLTEVISEGFKVSFSYNEKNGSTVCSLYDKREHTASPGACLTGGAGGWYDALRVVAYKYTVLMHGDMSAENSPAGLGPQIW